MLLILLSHGLAKSISTKLTKLTGLDQPSEPSAGNHSTTHLANKYERVTPVRLALSRPQGYFLKGNVSDVIPRDGQPLVPIPLGAVLTIPVTFVREPSEQSFVINPSPLLKSTTSCSPQDCDTLLRLPGQKRLQPRGEVPAILCQVSSYLHFFPPTTCCPEEDQSP